MVEIIDCPCCNGGKLKIELSSGYSIKTSGALSELPCIVYCKNCNRKIKYAVVKQDKVVEK